MSITNQDMMDKEEFEVTIHAVHKFGSRDDRDKFVDEMTEFLDSKIGTDWCASWYFPERGRHRIQEG